MKKVFILSFVAMGLMFTGCSSDDSAEPVTPENNNPDTCAMAVTATATAKMNYETASDANFAAACAAYKAALQTQIQLCGDSNGSLQATVNTLGACTAPVQNNGTVKVTAGSYAMVFDEVTVVKTGNIIKVTGDRSMEGNTYSIYFEVSEGATGPAAMQNFKLNLISSFQPYSNQFHSNITTNVQGVLKGTFYGVVINADNGVLDLTQGQIDVTY